MIEAEEVKTRVTEEDVLCIYARLAGAIKSLQKLFVAELDELKSHGAEIYNARMNIEKGEIYIKVNDISLFHEEKTWTREF